MLLEQHYQMGPKIPQIFPKKILKKKKHFYYLSVNYPIQITKTQIKTKNKTQSILGFKRKNKMHIQIW